MIADVGLPQKMGHFPRQPHRRLRLRWLAVLRDVGRAVLGEERPAGVGGELVDRGDGRRLLALDGEREQHDPADQLGDDAESRLGQQPPVPPGEPRRPADAGAADVSRQQAGR